MSKNPDLEKIIAWKPKPSAGIESKSNSYGFPTVIYRTPSALVKECEEAFDAGLLLAALSLVVTIPDVCAKIAGTEYRKWCEEYLDLVNDGRKVENARKTEKTQGEVEEGFEVIEQRGPLTASDLYNLRCAVVHAGSASIEGNSENYTPYHVIGVCVQGDANSVVSSYGHTGSGVDDLENCSYNCDIKLEGLISLMAKGVYKFIAEDSSRDCEYSRDGDAFRRRGVVDFRPLSALRVVK